MRQDSPGTKNHLHFHDGSTCHGFPTAQECVDDGIGLCEMGKVLEKTDTLADGTVVKCYSFIVAKFEHWAKHGKFVAEVKLVASWI